MAHLRKALLAALLLAALPGGPRALADEPAKEFQEAQGLYRSGQYFRAARYAFSAKEGQPALAAEANALIATSLTRAGLYNSASYFFIATLQSGNKAAIRRALTETQALLLRVGPDLLRKYLIRHTSYEDYDGANRSAFLYALGKEALLSGHAGDIEKAIGYLNAISTRSPLWPYALQLRGSAHAVMGKGERAVDDFRACAERAEESVPEASEADSAFVRQARREAEDLAARCIAGEARSLYQLERFEDADQAYDRIAKTSYVWPDILFEQAWNAFARKEYNRSLGKLVSYKSPALKFVFNPEIDVLRAQSFLALCLYGDANEVINEFNSRYFKVGVEVKNFVEANARNLPAFFDLGKQALRASLYTPSETLRMVNRFVRGPYFKGLVLAETTANAELQAIRRFDSAQGGVSHDPSRGFPGFLAQVIQWRLRSLQLLGGAFVKNSLLDHHAELLADFDKMSFIKLEMLKRAKDQLIFKNVKARAEDRSWGNVEPSRRDYQYYWGFNGEFWNDELGDYVFGLESECKGQGE